MSTDEGLGAFQASDFAYTPLALARNAPLVADRELDAWDMDAEWLGLQPDETPFEEFRRFQFDKLYFYPRRTGEDDIEYFPVEFRTLVYWVGEVPHSVETHITDTVNPHLRTLFNTGVYEGWMDGFTFERHGSNREASAVTRVGADEASNLGIGQWEVLVLGAGGTVRGTASGFFDPWRLTEFVPDEEIWNVTRNDARESYEIRPPGRARQRLMGQRKEVYLGGRFIGNTVPTRGTVWLRMEYDTQDGTWKDSHTGNQMWSRRKLVDDTAMGPQGVRAGGRVYKVKETSDRIFLVPTRADTPEGFDATDQADIPPEMADEAVRLALGDTTTFEVRIDRGDVLGKYTPPTTRTIERKTDWNTQPI